MASIEKNSVSNLFLKGASSPDPTQVYCDMRALRNDRVTIVEKGSPQSVCLMESGKVFMWQIFILLQPRYHLQTFEAKLEYVSKLFGVPL